MTVYQAMIVKGYKEGSVIVSENYNTGQSFAEGTCVQWDTTNFRWVLATDKEDPTTAMAIDGNVDSAGTTVSGSDVIASGKLPALIMCGMVANANFDDGAGNEYVPLVGDIGKAVVPSLTTAGRWELSIIAAGLDGDIYVGILRKLETINGVVMGIHDFAPRFIAAV